jgi:signal transduction histidine kinase
MFIGYVLSIKWTKPIYVLNEKAYKMSRLEFKPAVIKTGDELEELADSINNMSDQLEKALKELEHKKKSLETLLSDVSHELKTPISSINLYAHGIEDGLDDGTYFKGLYDNIDKIDNMILQLLNHSKITQMTLAKEDIDCVVLINDILSELDILLSRKELVLDLPDFKMIKGDSNQLRIAIKNLIVNACNYSEDNIVIQLKERLLIKNDVASFDKKKLPFLTDPFYVTDESRSGEQSGTGLGLFIVKNIMDKHGFDFSIDVIHNEFIVITDFTDGETF